jgi:hypothetical protein
LITKISAEAGPKKFHRRLSAPRFPVRPEGVIQKIKEF